MGFVLKVVETFKLNLGEPSMKRGQEPLGLVFRLRFNSGNLIPMEGGKLNSGSVFR